MHNTRCIVIAHSNHKFIETLSMYLTDKYQILLKSTDEGFEALRYIIKYNPELVIIEDNLSNLCLLYTSPSPRDQRGSRMPSSA